MSLKTNNYLNLHSNTIFHSHRNTVMQWGQHFFKKILRVAVFTLECTEKGKAQISPLWNCQTLWGLCIFRHCHSYLNRFHKNTLHSHIPQTYISSRIIMSNIISYQTQHLIVTLHPEVNVQFSSISIRLYLYQFSSAAWTQI